MTGTRRASGRRSSPLSTAQRSSLLLADSWSAVMDYLRFKPKVVKAVYCKATMKEKVQEALASHPSIALRSLQELPGYDERDFSSPVYAELDLQPLAEQDLYARIKDRTHDLILALDHVTDPRNLGAIARSAAFFGVKELLVARDRQVLLTKASVATAQGAFALSDLVVVTNLGRTLEKLKSSGYWIIGSALKGESVESLAGTYEKTVLVLGSEDKGLANGVLSKCDRLMSIHGTRETLNSLNVAVAAGIMLRGLFLGQNTSS